LQTVSIVLCQNSRMPNVQVARLSEQHLGAVVALERETYPPESQEAESLIAARLKFEDRNYSSLNLGIFDDERLVGYILAHLDDGAEFAAHGVGDNVYVADIAVLPRYRRQLIRLLQAFAREVRIEYPGLPVVAHSIHDTSGLWEKHAAVIQKLGGKMAKRIDNVTTTSGITASLVVWRHLAGDEVPVRKADVEFAPPLESYLTSTGRRLGVRIVTDEEGLLKLGESWRHIEALLPGITVFQTHRYQSAWVRNFALTRKLMIVCVYDGAELVGIAPFQVSLVELHRRELRQLSFLGAPWEVDRPMFLFPREAADCAEAAAQALLARRGQWDFIWFHEQLPGDAALEAFCTALRRRGLLHGRTASSRCPYLTFDGSWAQLLATKSQKFRKNLKAARRKLEASGKLDYEVWKGDVRRLQGLLLEYGELEKRSWKAKAGIGASQSVEHLRFYMHLASEFGEGGEFVFRCLRIDGRLIAATFGLVHRRRFYSLHIANDVAFAKHSAGTYLEALELEECYGADLDEYDFLGGFLKNKVRWATRMRETVAVHLYQKRPLLVAIFIGYFLVKAPLKRLLGRLGLTWTERPPENRLKESH
jgi:CelD/BcsL family acetyltransferase involved in cellulose biosynthesis